MKHTLTILLIFCSGISGLYSQTIFEAVKNNETGKILDYIAKKQNINLTDKNGASIFMYAVFYSDLETLKLLVTHGADPKKKGILYRDQTSYYGSPLCAAAGSGRTEKVRYLVEHCKIPVNERELDAETKTETGWTALHWAAWEGHSGICNYLLQQGADIDAVYAGDMGTPLIYAINNNKPETALHLIQAGANVNYVMPGNVQALHLCANLRQTKVLEAIVKKTDNVNALTEEGFTALMLAAYRYHFSCCDILLAHGADPALKNKHGYSALDYSANYPLLNGFLSTKQNPVSLIDKARISEYISIAVDFYWSGKYGETIELLEKILPGIEEQFGAADTSYYGMMLSYAAYSSYMKEDYTRAEEYYLKTISVFHKANVRSPMYNYSLFYLNKMYREQGLFEKAENTFRLLNESHKTNSGELSHAHFQSLTDFASFYQDYSRPSLAIAVYKNLMDLKIKRFGKSSAEYLEILMILADLYANIGNYADALWHYTEALQVNEKTHGRNSGAYAKNLYHLASLNFENANYALAEKEYKEAQSIQDRIYGKHHPDNLATTIGLAILYQAQANFAKAEKIFLQSLEIIKSSGDTLNADYAVILNNLAEFYRVTGEYSLSEGYFTNAIGIQKQIGLHLSEDIATTYNNLGLLYYNTGDYKRSEALFLECLKIRKIVLGSEHPNYASSLNNLSLVHRDLGNYESAVKLQLEAYQIREKAFGRIHPSVAVTLNNIGLIYLSHGEFGNARKAFLEAIDIQRKFFRKETVNLATYIDNYAYTLMEEKEFHEALPYMQEVLEIRKKLLGENHVHMATSHSNLGKVYLGLGKFSEAEKHFRKSTEIVRKSNGTFSNSYANSLIELALAAKQQNKSILADSLMIEANSIYNHFARICEKFMSEKEKYHFMGSVFSIYSDIFYSYFYQRYHENPSFSSHFYNKLIYEKGMLLNSSLAFRKQINKSVNRELLVIRDEYQLINQRLIKAFTERDTVFNYESMMERANGLEKMMIDILAVEGKTGGQILNYEQIRNSLSDTEAIVDFVNFRNFTNDWTDSIIYCALVIKRDFEAPRLFYLFNEDQMDKLLYRDPALEKKYQGQNPEYHYIRNLYQNRKKQADKSDSIVQISWRPFDNLLKDVKKVYLSPSGF
jgi:tetratricopeptide (TPR) repeat protein